MYVLLARAWSLVLPFATTALATNLFSALGTASAGGVLAYFLARITGSRAMAIAGALCAGGMFTVWSSATETEVYATVLLLAMLTLSVGERAGRSGEARWRVATAYAVALAVPLHLSALVTAPAAILLASQREDRSIDWWSGARLVATLMCAAGVGLASMSISLVGLLAFVIIIVVPRRGWRESLAILVCALIALSALSVMLLRSHFDPWINEGAPAHLGALWDAIGRRQYDTAGFWPRRAPLWAQVANWFEYADWQVALGISNGVAPTWLRTPVTLVFALLGIMGCRAHRRLHRRSWNALALLFLSATAGLIVYLNFKAGASFGWSVLSPAAPREVRDRDYFFVLGFWVWGAWAGIGAVAIAQRLGSRWIPIGVLAAAAPLVLNASAADRRAEPQASLARTIARALLFSAPPHAVLFTGGDNDSFPAWYSQAVEGERPDVTVVVAPLLGVRWYREQLARRDSLLHPGEIEESRGIRATMRSVVEHARARGRPVAVAIMAGEDIRNDAGAPSVARGLAFVSRTGARDQMTFGGSVPDVDTASTAALLRAVAPPPRVSIDDGIDPAPATLVAYLQCPDQYLATARGAMAAASLDSLCKLR